MNNATHELNRHRLPHFPALELQNQSVIVFLTVCVAGRRPILARSETVRVILDAWRKGDDWSAGRYVIMPEHIHLFCAPAKFPLTSLKRWVQF